MARFTLDPIDRFSKHAEIRDTQSDFYAAIDTDDVDRTTVLHIAEGIVQLLNEHSSEIPR